MLVIQNEDHTVWIILLANHNHIFYLIHNTRCRIPECDNSSSEYNSDWFNFTIPQTRGRAATCVRYGVQNTSLDDENIMIEPICSAEYFNQSIVDTCTSDFIYRNDELTILNEVSIQSKSINRLVDYNIYLHLINNSNWR